MTVDDELVTFFSDLNRLKQVDRLHSLLFDCLDEAQNELDRDIKKAIGGLIPKYAENWRPRNESPPIKAKYQHIGFVPKGLVKEWPEDLWAHFGWDSNLLKADAWVGVYTRTQNKSIYKKLQDSVKRTLPAAEENEFGNGDDAAYPIFKTVPNWPSTNWDGRNIKRDTKFAPLSHLLTDRGAQIVRWVTENLCVILDQLES